MFHEYSFHYSLIFVLVFFVPFFSSLLLLCFVFHHLIAISFWNTFLLLFLLVLSELLVGRWRRGWQGRRGTDGGRGRRGKRGQKIQHKLTDNWQDTKQGRRWRSFGAPPRLLRSRWPPQQRAMTMWGIESRSNFTTRANARDVGRWDCAGRKISRIIWRDRLTIMFWYTSSP